MTKKRQKKNKRKQKKKAASVGKQPSVTKLNPGVEIDLDTNRKMEGKLKKAISHTFEIEAFAKVVFHAAHTPMEDEKTYLLEALMLLYKEIKALRKQLGQIQSD